MARLSEVYYNLDETQFIYEVSGLKFYFSSKFYMDKFINSYEGLLIEHKMKLECRYKCKIESNLMILLYIYKTIEKRGFKVYYNDKRIDENYVIKLSL